MSVLVLGDANVDLEIRLPAGSGSTELANPEPRLFGGGSAANTAAALARLKVGCRFVGSVGDDVYGRFAISSLEAAGVDTGAVLTTLETSTVTVITIVQPDGDRLIYVWPPTGGAHGALDEAAAVAAVPGARWLHVSGICLRLEPSRGAVLTAMERAKDQGIPVSFDLNLRLENWGWDDGFRGAVDAAIDRSDVVLGGAFDEIGALCGMDDPVDAATSLAGDGRLVVARLGAEGAVACSAAGVVESPGLRVEVLDTVGAGDAFDAGFITARLDGGDVATALRWGNAVAALAITRSGARSTPSRVDVESFLGE